MGWLSLCSVLAGQLDEVGKNLVEQVGEIDKLPSSEQKLYLAEVLLAETRLAAVNLVKGDDANKLQALEKLFLGVWSV